MTTTVEGSRRLTILLVEDADDDVLIAKRALRRCGGAAHALHIVRDGREALDYLRREGDYAEPGTAPRPDIVLLDVNMPRLDGFEVLDIVKKDPALRTTPIIVLTTSTADWDVRRAYELGANSYVVKPESFRETVRVIGLICEYWSTVGVIA